MTRLEVTDAPRSTDLAQLGAALAEYNAADVGPAGKRELAVFLRDAAGTMVGGLAGYTAWGWLYIQWLWLAKDQRGQGAAGRLLCAAENEARARGCHGAWIDTFNPVALLAYQRAGYEPFGTLPDFPLGRCRTFLRKDLSA